MLTIFFIYFVTVRVVASQINGEFWWLNKNLAKLQNVEPLPPKFDNTNEFDTDESVKITFKDNDMYTNEPLVKSIDKHSFIYVNKTSPISINSQNHSKLSESGNDIFVNQNNNSVIEISEVSSNKSSKRTSEGYDDIFEFVFPVTDDIMDKKEPDRKKKLNNVNSLKKTPNNPMKNVMWPDMKNELDDTESICTFKTKRECIQSKGVIHRQHDLTCSKLHSRNSQKVCCILPLEPNTLSKIVFPDSPEKKVREKRTVKIENVSSAMRQRNALLQRKLALQSLKLQPTASTMQTKTTQKIVTLEDYTDPYWNIKNGKFRYPNQQSGAYQDGKYDFSTQDYSDYEAEIPKPGLVGIYSDIGSGQTTWKLTNKNKGFSYGITDYVSEEQDGDDFPFGYSTFDPRLGNRASSATQRPIRRKPTNMMTSPSDSVMVTSESQTVKFNSNPDYNVMEGFKLINLGGSKNRFVRTTTQANIESEDANVQPCEGIPETEVNMDDLIDLKQQVYKKCGKSVNNFNVDGVASEGFDPWLALVIRTKSHKDILCYATIVHPRIAVTAADCVHGKSPGEVSLMTGMWEVNEDHTNTQQRLCTVHAHPNYRNGELDNDLAVLHWKRPLRMETNVQPVCIADPHVGDECYFVGWGGYDKAMEQESRRQRASILTPKKCRERISKPDITLPQDSFCASVKDRGTVTGVGGPLLCRGGEGTSMVGMAVWREDVVVLLPPMQWLATSMPDVLRL